MADYDIGDVVRLTATFSNVAGVATDTTAVLSLEAPDGTVTTPSVTHGATGVYTVDVTPTAFGVWYYRWSGTGGVTTAEEGAFTVRRRRVP
jgi:hypothetical protein